MPKYLLVFEKGESVRWLSHLDIHRTFERAIRRAALPIAFSQGFNPRERLSFVSALSTGVTGSEELLVLEFTAPREPQTITTDLNAVLPNGIRIRHSEEIADAEVKLIPKEIDRAEYRVVCGCATTTTPESVHRAVNQLLQQDEVIIQREKEGRVRNINIRPSLYTLSLLPERENEQRLTLCMILGQGEGGTVRPAEIVTALQKALPELTLRRAHRVRMRTTQGEPRLHLSAEVSL
jgi:radical SAM-linked protein